MQLPTRTINAESRISVRRRLPVAGEILVQPGQRVEPLNVVARAEMPSQYRVIHVARQLGLEAVDMEALLDVEPGSYVEANEVVASRTGRFSFLDKIVRAPAAGYVTSIGPGWILMETERSIVEIQAFINGIVTRVLPNFGVVIEADGSIVEAACGFGGEAYGRLVRRVDSPYEALRLDALDESSSESIVIGGRTVDEETLRQAEEWGVRGIIVGSIPASFLKLEPSLRVRVVATEGFGDLPMSPHTFGVLTSMSRKPVSIRGRTPSATLCQASYGTMDSSPIILVADPPKSRGGFYSLTITKPKPIPDITTGSRVRIIQGQSLGSSGIVDLIPPEPQATAAGLLVPGAYVKVNNDVHFVPWANLELII